MMYCNHEFVICDIFYIQPYGEIIGWIDEKKKKRKKEKENGTPKETFNRQQSS
jgi:hypothetical protein